MVRETLSRLSAVLVLSSVIIATASVLPNEGSGSEAAGAPVASVTAAGSATLPARALAGSAAQEPAAGQQAAEEPAAEEHAAGPTDYWSLLFVFLLASFIGMGVIRRVSRLLHTPLMSLTNAISAIAVVGSIIVTGSDYPTEIRVMGAIACFASVTNIVSGFLITDRMLKMFKTTKQGGEA